MARRKPVSSDSDANDCRSAKCPVCRTSQGLTEKGTFLEHRNRNIKGKNKCAGSHTINKSFESRMDWLSSRPGVETVYVAYPPLESGRMYKVTIQFIGEPPTPAKRQVVEHKYLGVALKNAIKWCKENGV